MDDIENDTLKLAYDTSVLKQGTISEVLKDLTQHESLDDNVEKLLIEMSNEFINNTLNYACQLVKMRKTNQLEPKDIAFSLDKNYDIKNDDDKLSEYYQKLKATEIKNLSTADHKRRMELTREECKNLL
jgi:transcription initiation factor TFIID subunit 12